MTTQNKNMEYRLEHKNYWITKFSGELPTLNLPSTKVRPSEKLNLGQGFRCFFSEQETLQLEHFVANNQGDFFDLLLAAWSVLFYKYTAQKNSLLGTRLIDNFNFNGLNREDPYSGTLLFLAEVEPSENFTSFYHKVTKTRCTDVQNLAYGLNQLITDMTLIPQQGRTTVFDVLVDFEQLDVTLRASQPWNFKNDIEDLGEKTVKADIEISFCKGSDFFYFDLVCDNGVYETTLMQNLVLHYKTLILRLIVQPAVPIDDIDYITDHERNLVLNVFNKPKVSYPKNKTIVDLFLDQVAKTPDKIAVVNNEIKLSYNELDILSNQLANYLISVHKIAPGDFVAIMLNRSEWQIVSIIAILKTGAAYIPILPDYPLERIKFKQNDSKCKATLDIVEIDKFKIAKLKYPATRPSNINISVNDLAYVIYTSGTTGNPKGVLIRHEGVVHLIAAETQSFNLGQDEKIVLSSSFCFDASVELIFLALFNGGELHIISEEILKNNLLLRFLEKNEITHLEATPSYLEILPDINHLAKLKRISAGGEICSLKTAKRLSQSCDFYNTYGPTENTVTSTSYKYTIEDDLKSSLPIGSPIGNTSAYILSQSQKLQGIGMIGELYLSGVGLAQGYLNLPELTAEKFIENPFRPNSKMYRTGDLARWDANGNIEFIGRTDDQVKIRGYRIELGEVEKNLESIDNIKTAIVLKQTDRLIAYVLLDNDEYVDSLKIKEWKNYLATKLPDYFIPYEIKIIKELPITPNGKLDKKALVNNYNQNHIEGVVHTEPRTESEKLVATIWKESLNIDQIDIFSNFFEIGGNSIRAVKLIFEIKKQTGKQIPISSLFENSTVEKFAKLIEKENSNSLKFIVPIKPEGSKVPLFIVHGSGLNVLNFQYLASHFDADQPVYGLQGLCENGYENWFESIEDMANSYNKELIAIVPEGPYALSGFSFGGVVAFEMARQLKQQGRTVSTIALLDTYVDPSYYFATIWQKKIARYYERSHRRLEYLAEMLSSWSAFKNRIQTKKEYILKTHRTKNNAIDELESLALEEFKLADGMVSKIVDRFQLKPQHLAVDLFRAEDDDEYKMDPTHLGWKKAALKGITIHTIRGNHLEIIAPPNDKVLAGMIQKLLDTRHS
jgi:amino acid adenylation domain-containing protein